MKLFLEEAQKETAASVSVSEQYNAESEAPRACLCVVVIFFMFFVLQSEGAWVDVLLPVRIIAHVH